MKNIFLLHKINLSNFIKPISPPPPPTQWNINLLHFEWFFVENI